MRGLLARRPVSLKEVDCSNTTAAFPNDVLRDWLP